MAQMWPLAALGRMYLVNAQYKLAPSLRIVLAAFSTFYVKSNFWYVGNFLELLGTQF